MTTKNDWFRVDKEGLAQVYARRGPAAPFFELISNAWDEEGVTTVELEVTAVPNSPMVEVRCKDDSTQGFRDLNDAFTLFAPSYKKGDAERRGRFNVGEKLFLALCSEASIMSTGGTIQFNRDGSLKRTSRRTQRGTEIYAKMRMTRGEAAEAFVALGSLIPPERIHTRIEFQGFDLEGGHLHHLRRHGRCALTFEAKLQTELSDNEGVIRPSERIGKVEVWDADPGVEGWLFEMGIPVVEIGGQFTIDVHQKVPLNVDRDNVKPAFLRRLRAHVLNHGYSRLLTHGAATAAWVTEALGSQSPTPTSEAIAHVLDLRFGRKRVIYDPSDREGSEIAMSKGYTVVSGGALPATAWTNIKATGSMKPAGQVTPSSRAVFSAGGEDVHIPPHQYPPGGLEVCAAFVRLAHELNIPSIRVRIVKRLQSDHGSAPAACYGDGELLLNLRKLGTVWFKRALDNGLQMDHVELLVHELGHEYESSHLSQGFHESQTRMGVKLAFLAVELGASLFKVTA